MKKNLLVSLILLSSCAAFASFFNLEDESTFISRSVCACKEYCYQKQDCAAAFWRPYYDAFLCKIHKEKTVPISFEENSMFYCKDCSSSLENVQHGINSGVIYLKNVALHKSTDGSSVYISSNPEISYDSSKAVDGDKTTLFHTSRETRDVESIEWLMIDLGVKHLIYKLFFLARNNVANILDRAGHFKVYLSNTFNINDNFSSYPTILEIIGDAKSTAETYNVSSVLSGRYVIIERQELLGYIEFIEVEVYGVVNL